MHHDAAGPLVPTEAGSQAGARHQPGHRFSTLPMARAAPEARGAHGRGAHGATTGFEAWQLDGRRALQGLRPWTSLGSNTTGIVTKGCYWLGLEGLGPRGMDQLKLVKFVLLDVINKIQQTFSMCIVSKTSSYEGH